MSAALGVLYLVCIALAAIGFETRGLESELRFGIFIALIGAGYATLRALERRASRREADAARAAAGRAELAPAQNQAAG